MKRKLTTKASYAATHLCGICAAMAVLMCLAFTSCSKDYPKLVKERVEQYRKEGKWVLSYSKNATEDEHFIVYADEKTQAIVVDSIDGENIVSLKKLKEFQVAVSNDESIIWTDIQEDIPLKIITGKNLLLGSYEGNYQVEKMTGYKDKYMIARFGPYRVAIIFFNANKVYGFGLHDERYYKHIGTDYKITDNGDIKVRLRYEFAMGLKGLPEYLPCSYSFVFDCNGNIKSKDKYVDCYGVQISTSTFGGYYDSAFEFNEKDIKEAITKGDYQTDDFYEGNNGDETTDDEWSTEETASPSNNDNGNNVAEERQSEPQPAEQQEVSNSNRQPFKLVPVDEEPSRPAEDNKIFDVVEERPSFPGGDAALTQWLSNNIRYPESAASNGIQGRVVVQFVISRTGVIRDVKVLRGVDPALDREAMRVVRSMPRWTPGKQAGVQVNVRYTLPITFRL